MRAPLRTGVVVPEYRKAKMCFTIDFNVITV